VLTWEFNTQQRKLDDKANAASVKL